MAPFGRESPTSYSTLMVPMTLSASVSKLQPSEICVTSILTSPGQSRSKPIAPFERASLKPIAPFERASMTSYSTLMVTMALSASQASHSASKDLKDSSSKNKGQLSEIKDLKDKILTTAKR